MTTRRIPAFIRFISPVFLFMAVFSVPVEADPRGKSLLVTLAVLGGTTLPDPDFADYRWDVSGAFSWGAEMGVSGGGSALGLRMTRWETRQSTGLLGETTAPEVALTSVEIRGRARFLSFMGTSFSALAGAGRVHLGYSPDHLSLDSGGATGPVEVDFPPADEWIGSLGMGLDRPVTRNLGLGLEIDHSLFSLDTANRNGGVVEEGRRTFGSWSIRFRMNWILRTL